MEENEVVEDMDYVVYIDTTEEGSCVESEAIDQEESIISQNTISENTVSNKSSKQDKTEEAVKENLTQSNSEEINVNIQESIEKAEEILSKEGAELIDNEETIIYTTDLNQTEIKELQESEVSIVVEENIELFGAGKKSQIDSNKESKKEKKEKDKKSTKETEKGKAKADKQKDSNKKRSKAYDLKMAMKQSREETEEKEPEWNVNMVNGDVAGEMEGETVKVAVMDSGIELLSGIPVQQISNLVATEQDLPYYMNDMTGHGTAIAGIINDIAPNAEIYSVRIMDAENKATLSRVVEGIYWCIENDIDIINMSFGTTVKSAVLEKAIKDASDAGILLISSAGNGDIEGVEYPAAYEEVIAVGAVNTSAKKTEESAVGEKVELVAPGEQILSDSMLGLETVVSGTSMAAPHVTAVAAVLWQKDKTKSPAFIRSLLAQTANELGDTEEYGNGLIDLEYALAKYDEFAEKYEEAEKDINSGEGISTNLQDEQKLGTQSDMISPIVEAEEQLIKENTTTVEIYEDVDYVEGRWGGNKGHKVLVDNANKSWGYVLSEEEVAIFKLGAVYPDEEFPVSKDRDKTEGYRNWHGGSSANHIANYRYVTKVAQDAGNSKTYTRAKGQTEKCHTQMQEIFKTPGKIGKKEWKDIIKNKKIGNVIYDYGSLKSKSKKKKWRKLFLYGMASHIVTDTFAHGAYIKNGNGYEKIKHDKNNNKVDADNPSYIENRFVDAQEAMSMVIINYEENWLGTEIDFTPSTEFWGKSRGYYLANILKKAKAVAIDLNETEIEEVFKPINYTVPKS